MAWHLMNIGTNRRRTMKADFRMLLLAFLLLLASAALSGCFGRASSGGGNQLAATPSIPSMPSADHSDSGGELGEYKEKYDPPVTITTVWGVDPTLSFKNGETIENNVATKWALNTFGIKIESLWSVTDTNNAFATKLRLAMSSSKNMPDVVTTGDLQLAQDMIDSGLFREVGTLFDKYANEKWKRAMDLDQNVWNPYVRGDRKMGIPVLDYSYNHDYLIWIRQDWLEKLNLQAPKTINELERVMDAFKNNNPDGLTSEEVIPLSIGFKNTMNTWMGDPSWIFGAYGTIPQQWNMGANGGLQWGSIQPEMKQGLVKLKEWRSKGYIPSEAALWDENKTAEPAVAGTAGIIPGPYWMSGWPLSETKKSNEDAVWKPYPVPAGPDGNAGRHGTFFANGVTLINRNMEHPEALFTYQNYLFEHFADPQPGDVFDNGVFRGYDYDVDDMGNIVYLDQIPGGVVNINRYWLVKDGARIPDAQMKAMLNLSDGGQPVTRQEKEVKNSYGSETPTAARLLLSQNSISYMNRFTGPATPTMKLRQDYLNKIEMRTFNEIIYGERGPEAFDEFVRLWKKSGGDRITQEVNEWDAGVND